MSPGVTVSKEILGLGNAKQIYLFTLCVVLAPSGWSGLH